MTFCTDIDLLHWEPNIFRDAAFASQTLLSGSGDLAGTVFTLAAGSLATAHIAANHPIVLSNGIDGTFPIVSIDTATQLTLSVLYDGIFPVGSAPVPSPVATATGLNFAIRTFWPQRRIVSELLIQAAGLDPAGDDADSILNPSALTRACALGTLQMIYSALAAAAEEPENLLNRATMYERLYRRELRCAKVEIDESGDGRATVVRPLNVLQLQRV
jgi:hypothetical protein